MLADHAMLHQLVRDGNIPLLLQKLEIVGIFDLTCTLCSRTFKRKNDLQSHLINIHAEYWKQVEPLVLKLVNHFQGSATNCYCTPKTKQWGKHQCSVFRQFALLRHVVFPNLSNEHLILGTNTDTQTKLRPYIMDCPADAALNHVGSLGLYPYPDFSSQEYLDDASLAANLERMLLKPQDTCMPLLDKVQLMISGSTEVFSCLEFEKILHSHMRINAPTIIHTALGCDFAAMSRAREVSYFSEYCAICNYRFDSSDTVWLHMCSHVTLLNPGASVYTLGNLLNQFLDACHQAGGQTSHLHVQAALKQQFVLRVIALHYGSRRQQDAANDGSLEAPPTSRDSPTSEETFRRRNTSSHPSPEETKPGQTDQQNQGRGLFPERGLKDAHSDDYQARGPVEDTGTRPRIHHSHGHGTGWSDAGTSPIEPARAHRDQKRPVEACLGKTPDIHHQHQVDGPSGVQKRLRTLEGICESLTDTGVCYLPYLQWDAHSQSLIPSKEKPLPLKEVKEMMEELLQQFEDQTLIMKFHSLKKTSQDSNQVQSVPWSLTLSNRVHPMAWQHLTKLCFHSIWQLALIRMRPANLKRSALAQQLQKPLKDLWLCLETLCSAPYLWCPIRWGWFESWWTQMWFVTSTPLLLDWPGWQFALLDWG